MAIKRYYAKLDNTITNAFEENLVTRGTGSNMGASDILEVFSIYGQDSGSSGLSSELSRILVKFDCTASTDSIKADRDAGTIPASGNVNFFLRLYNAEHGQTLPKSYTMDVSAISGSWNEGTGLDMELYKDKGFSNWISASSTAGWVSEGADYFTDISSSFSASFDSGVEDIELDITTLVEQWCSSSDNSKTAFDMGLKADEGVLVKLSSVYETATRSYYTKKFFARGTEFFFKKPCIEARWNSSIEDDRGNFYYSSSLATAEENLNTLYFYNYFRGRLRNIPGIDEGNIGVSIFSSSAGAPTGSAITLVADGTSVRSDYTLAVTGGYVSTGIYSASFAITAAATPLTTINDVWFKLDNAITNAAAGVQYGTGSVEPKIITNMYNAPTNDYVTAITNLRDFYRTDETARFRIYTRQKDWSPTIYTKAVNTPEVQVVESGSYEIYRVIDDLKVIPYGTGSTKHTFLSYDTSGSYFDLDMNMFETGYSYGIKLSFYNEDIGAYVEQPNNFIFKVE